MAADRAAAMRNVLANLGAAAAGGDVAACRALADAAKQPGGARALDDAGCVEALLAAVHGSGDSGGMGLQRTLILAVTGKLPEAPLAALDALAALAEAPTLVGRIAGSGVLGLASAVVLSPASPSAARAVALRAAAAMAIDNEEVAQAAGEERAQEFSKLRKQLFETGVVTAAAKWIGDPWDGVDTAFAESDDDDDDDDLTFDPDIAAAETLERAACAAVSQFSRDATFAEAIVAADAHERLLKLLPAPHASAALRTLALMPLASEKLLAPNSVRRLSRAVHRGEAAVRRDCLSVLASVLSTVAQPGADATLLEASRMAVDAALEVDVAQHLRRAVVLGGADTAREVARLCEALSIAGGDDAARALSSAGVPKALAAALQ